MRISVAKPDDMAAVMPLVTALWPDEPAELLSDLLGAKIFGAAAAGVILVARSDGDETIGFAFVTVRVDYVNGCDSSPVAFLEGIYIDPSCRRMGIGRRLVDAAAGWGGERGCREFASDALLDNVDSQAFHRSLGF